MTGFFKELQELSSAEDFFQALEVPYDPRLLSSGRLHILKRFHNLIASSKADEEPSEERQKKAYRQALLQAYEDFSQSSPQAMKLFKAFQIDADRRSGFVSVAALREQAGAPKN